MIQVNLVIPKISLLRSGEGNLLFLLVRFDGITPIEDTREGETTKSFHEKQPTQTIKIFRPELKLSVLMKDCLGRDRS